MYCCGPTVYDFAHIGNWRTFVFGDLVRRSLEFKGYAVTHVMNITDVEDKIIKRVRLSRQSAATAEETKTSLREFTGKYEAAFFEDLKTLNCLLPHHTPRATEHIAEIISLIEKLIARGIAYQAADGSVYFSIEKYRGCGCTYGQLLKLNFDEMRAGRSIASRATNTPRNPSPISRSGRRACRRTATFSGPARSAKAGPAGTSSAAR